ncbi:MAG: PLP-dependent aminotransferase family protein [Chloroflexota bacterium]|nr:PLP-dependent aminotransferase family protein [Chloroflexota bacterium]
MTTTFDIECCLSDEARQRAEPGTMVSASGAPEDIVADLLVGQPANEALPLEQMVEAARNALPENYPALLYGRRKGSLELVDVVREKLRVFEGLEVDRDQIIITNGSGQAIDMVLRTFVNRDQIIALDHASFGALFVRRVSDHGAHVDWDADGPRVDALDELFATREPAVFYTIPTFQNPMGTTITRERRLEVLEVCHRHGVPVFEDDAYYELHYDGERPPSLYELDGGTGLVTRAGTFSKILGAGIRLGWILTSPALADRILPLKTDGGTSPFSSALASEFMREHMEEQIARLQDVYRERRDIMLAALEQHIGDLATWVRPNGGFFFWLTLRRPELLDDVIQRCERAGVLVRSGAIFRVDSNGLGAIRLAFSHAPHDQLRTGVEVLGREIRASIAANP